LRDSGLTVAISSMLKLAAEGGGPKGAMKRMVEQNKEKYKDALAEFDDLDSKEATEVRQRLFREDWEKSMAEDAMSRSTSTSTTMDVTMKIEQMQEQNADVFAIPDYFVYMSRAFSTLEGIGLSFDSNYSILKECYPYLAKRLLSDDSPRARGALRMLLYGKGEDLDLSKLQELSSGLESYTTTTSSVESSRGESDEGRSAAFEEVTNVVLSEDGNYVQELLIREAAVALDASLRDAFTSPLAPLNNLPNPPAALRPFAFPLELAKASLELQSLDDRDQQRLKNVRIITELGQTAFRSSGSSSDDSNMNTNRFTPGLRGNNTIGKLVQETAKRRLALARIGMRFGGSLASVQAERLRSRSSGTKGKLVKNMGAKESETDLVTELAKQLANVGADRLEEVADAIASVESNLGKRR